MKILFAIDSLCGGGAERVISLLANQIHVWGYEVDILLAFSNKIEYQVDEGIGIYDLNGNLLEHTLVKNESVVLGTGACSSSARKSFLRKFRENISEYRDRQRRIKQLTRFVNEKGYDAVISFLTSTNELVGAASKKIRAKTILSERCSPMETVILQKKGKWTLKQYNKADRIVFQTPDAMSCYPLSIQKKGDVIPNPIKTELPSRFEGERKKEIVSFGRLDKQKNLPMLIYGFAEISKQYSDYTLKLFGRGQEKNALIELVRQLNLSDKVYIEDFAKDIHEKVKDAAMYVSTSDYEGISNAMLEALAIGVPCVCTDCPAGGARMAIQDGVNGLLVPTKDVASLVVAMKKIIDSAKFSDQLSKNAVKVKERWNIEEIARKWLEVVES